MANQMKYRRRRFWIEPRLQMKYIIFNLAYLMIFAFIVGGGIYMGIWHSVVREFSVVKVDRNLQEMKRIHEYQIVRTRQEVDSIPIIKDWAKMLSDHDKATFNEILIRANKILIPFVLIAACFVTGITILMSHKVAGPVFRLKRDLKSVIDGDLTVRFSLRQRDELKDLASSIDTAIHGFALNIDKVRHCLEQHDKTQSEQDRQKYIVEAEQILDKYRVLHEN
ncbi:MAG: hypothetical protein ABII64_02770 [Elusimicrobiota bacterium]